MTELAKSLDFIVVGASKAGTTALFRYLRTDPDLYLPLDKEAPFFAVDEHYDGGWQSFARRYFSEAPPGSLWGTVTPRYMEDPRVPRRIAADMPDTRLIALLRNPIDRAHSQYRQQVRRGKETLDFADRIAESLLDVDRGDEIREPILGPGHYGRILGRFREHFPAERLLVTFSEHLKDHPREVIDAIREFLGLATDFNPPNLGKRYHVGGTRQRFPGLVPALRRIPPLRWLWRRLPKDRRGGIWAWFFTQVNVVPEAAEEMPADLRRRLADHFHDDVEELSRLIGMRPPWKDFEADR